jgi:phage tail-like protein
MSNVPLTPAVRFDPLRTYQFLVALLGPLNDTEARAFLTDPGGSAGPYIAGVKKVSGLNMTIAANEIREGGNSLHRYANPDRATWDPITLEQGLAIDNTLEKWAAAAADYLRYGSVTGGPVKRNVLIDVWDPARVTAERYRRYLVFNAWVSRFQAIPQLDAMANEVALLTVELTHEGWRVESPPATAQRGG